MELRPFWLVNAEDSKDVFAVGLDLGDEAITYHRNPASGKAHFGRHKSAEAALRFYSHSVNIALEWADEWIDALLDWVGSRITDPAELAPLLESFNVRTTDRDRQG